MPDWLERRIAAYREFLADRAAGRLPPGARFFDGAPEDTPELRRRDAQEEAELQRLRERRYGWGE